MTNFNLSAYAELAAVVGNRNVSTEDFITFSHDWVGLGALGGEDSLLGNPPGAVVLPGSTDEVAQVIKICNKYKIKFKAHSTGFGALSGVYTKGAVSIDLRRMNSLEIDAKCRMAIIEPYATAGELLAESIKHHLMCHIIGAGPMHSPLASAAAFAGVGTPGNHTGNNSRNLLSLEWVTPEGEIVRIGSSASGAGWFTGEGPGPGFRGIIRGLVGTAGGLGVFTKIGIKLYPWAGPQRLEWVGQHPQRGIMPPRNFELYQLGWENWSCVADATHHFQKSRIVTFITRVPPNGIGNMLNATNDEYYRDIQENKVAALARAENATGWTVMLMAWSAVELAWKKKVLENILQYTAGWKVSINDYEKSILTANFFTSIYIARFIRMGDAVTISLGILESSALIPDVVQRAEQDIAGENRPGGSLLETETEQSWMWVSEGRHFWAENNPVSSRFSKKGRLSVLLFILSSFTRNEKSPVGVSFFICGDATDLFGSKLGGVHKWMRRVKNLWDPHDLSASNGYISAQPFDGARIAPILKFFLARSWLRRLLIHFASISENKKYKSSK
jgi:glycolate oxidase